LLEGVRAQARALHDEALAIGRNLVEEGGQFPHRLHVKSLGGRYLFEYAAMLERWATWAEQQVRRWPDTSPRSARHGRVALEATIASFAASHPEAPRRSEQ
jgi:hypothetical protein